MAAELAVHAEFAGTAVLISLRIRLRLFLVSKESRRLLEVPGPTVVQGFLGSLRKSSEVLGSFNFLVEAESSPGRFIVILGSAS